jgi:MEMO1 family protein
MPTRKAIRAGSFYPADAATSQAEARDLIDQAPCSEDLPTRRYGGLAPHAGWVYSGLLAARTIRALFEAGPEPTTVILLGADHTGQASLGEVWPDGEWTWPGGAVPVDDRLAEALIAACPAIRANAAAHDYEHSLEVQVPLLYAMDDEVRIVPVAVPATEVALEVGEKIGRYLTTLRKPGEVTLLGSTDLTHHGGHFGSPGGTGKQSEAYASENDHALLEHVLAMDGEAVLRHAAEHHSACGAGAIAATIEATRQLGATRGQLLEYTNSYRITHARRPNLADDTSVGYASVVFV